MRDSTADQDRPSPAAIEYVREKPDGTLDPLGEAGWYLQHERETRGETLDQAGEMTGIHPYHIAAIEYGDMTRMPERVEALDEDAAPLLAELQHGA